jgi:hypothetical protein
VPFAVTDDSIGAFTRGVRKRGFPLRASSGVRLWLPAGSQAHIALKTYPRVPYFCSACRRFKPWVTHLKPRAGLTSCRPTVGALIRSVRPGFTGWLLEHATSDITIHLQIPFAIVMAVLAFLRMGPARQRPRDPALRRRGSCGVFCAAGPRRRL